MANELERGRIYMRFFKNGEEAEFEALTQFLTVSGTEYILNVQSVSKDTKEDLAKGDITTIGYVIIKNEDTTNFCSFGDDADNPSIEAKAGEVIGPLRWSRSVANISALADTGAVRVRYLLIED